MNEMDLKAWLMGRLAYLNDRVLRTCGNEKCNVQGQIDALQGLLKGIERGNFK